MEEPNIICGVPVEIEDPLCMRVGMLLICPDKAIPADCSAGIGGRGAFRTAPIAGDSAEALLKASLALATWPHPRHRSGGVRVPCRLEVLVWLELAAFVAFRVPGGADRVRGSGASLRIFSTSNASKVAL